MNTILFYLVSLVSAHNCPNQSFVQCPWFVLKSSSEIVPQVFDKPVVNLSDRKVMHVRWKGITFHVFICPRRINCYATGDARADKQTRLQQEMLQLLFSQPCPRDLASLNHYHQILWWICFNICKYLRNQTAVNSTDKICWLIFAPHKSV